jgi:hypothetical protein
MAVDGGNMAGDYLEDISRVSLRTAEITDAAAYAQTMANLEQQAFWSGRGGVRELWPHQRTAMRSPRRTSARTRRWM